MLITAKSIIKILPVSDKARDDLAARYEKLNADEKKLLDDSAKAVKEVMAVLDNMKVLA